MLSIREIIVAARKMGGSKAEGTYISDRLAAFDRRNKRQEIGRAWKIKGMMPSLKARTSRAINRISRKGKPYGQSSLLGTEEHTLLLRRMRPSDVLDSLYPDRADGSSWLKLKDRDLDKEAKIDLSNFSFLDDPNGTIVGLKKIAEAEARAPGARINFKDKYCLDVAPYMLLMECWDQMLPIFDGGKMNLPVQKVLASVGILQAMGIGVLGVNDLEGVWAFPLSRRRGAGSTESKCAYIDVQSRELVIDRFCDALDEWLDKVDTELTSSGRGWIKNILGELLENAERHSDGDRRDGPWSVSGFMAYREDEVTGEWNFHVRLGIVNLGDTFSESLERARPETSRLIDAYVSDMHAKGAVQSRETLRTLAGLQDGVTCVAEADDDDRGGYGLQEMLDMVGFLGETGAEDRKPRVTIISGSTCIQLRTPYIRGTKMGPGNSPRVLWCNESNSKDAVPDDAYVFDLDTSLPGTSISVGFILDHEYYRQSGPEGVEDGNDQSE